MGLALEKSARVEPLVEEERLKQGLGSPDKLDQADRFFEWDSEAVLVEPDDLAVVIGCNRSPSLGFVFEVALHRRHGVQRCGGLVSVDFDEWRISKFLLFLIVPTFRQLFPTFFYRGLYGFGR